jgi:hypothetical protein
MGAGRADALSRNSAAAPVVPVPLDPATPTPSDLDAPLTPSLRWLLVAAAVLVFLAGVQLFVFPLRTDRYFAWTIGSPMTASFLGASYWSAVALELGGSRARTWSGARIAIPAVGLFTAVTLIVTEPKARSPPGP